VDKLLVAPLRAAASVIASAQAGKLRCAGEPADYAELLNWKNVGEIIVFMQQEVTRLSLGALMVRLSYPNNLDLLDGGGAGLYLEAYTPEAPDLHNFFYVIRILNDPNSPGLEIEQLT
jgi:hypothetical protein